MGVKKGAAIGAGIGLIGGPIGVAAGGVIGGLLGKWFGGEEEKPQEDDRELTAVFYKKGKEKGIFSLGVGFKTGKRYVFVDDNTLQFPIEKSDITAISVNDDGDSFIEFFNCVRIWTSRPIEDELGFAPCGQDWDKKLNDTIFEKCSLPKKIERLCDVITQQKNALALLEHLKTSTLPDLCYLGIDQNNHLLTSQISHLFWRYILHTTHADDPQRLWWRFKPGDKINPNQCSANDREALKNLYALARQYAEHLLLDFYEVGWEKLYADAKGDDDELQKLEKVQGGFLGDYFPLAGLCTYEVGRTLTGKGEIPPENSALRLHLSDWRDDADNDIKSLGDPERKKERKFIVCSDAPMELTEVMKPNPKVPLGTLVALAQDLEAYNEDEETPENRLHFELGHPKNGFTYIQHPLRQNIYYEVNAFHQSMLLQKHSELMRVLSALGATHVEAVVAHQEGKHSRKGRDTNVGTSLETFRTGVNAKVRHDTSLDEENALYQRLAQSCDYVPSGKPHIPDDVVFFPHEEQWQQIANDVLAGKLKHAEVCLEYRSDYAVTKKGLTQVNAKLQLLIPSIEVNVSTEFEESLHTMTSTVWRYIVDFAPVARTTTLVDTPTAIPRRPESLALPEAARSTPSEPVSAEPEGAEPAPAVPVAAELAPAPGVAAGADDEVARAEALIRKRAKRYLAKSPDGTLSEGQQAELDALAQKVGLSALRLEELIEEAYE